MDMHRSGPQTATAKPSLYLAEFDSAKDILHAAEKVHAAGYKVFDTHTPFPVHGMDKAMGLPDSFLGRIVFPIGLLGTLTAFTMMHWMNGIDYPIIIGGKPAGAPGALPSMIPVMFELTILFTAFATVFGMLHLNRLPRHHHPVFYSDRFAAFSNDKFFLSIEATDSKFDVEGTKTFLESLHPTYLELVHDDEEADEAAAHGHEEEAHG